MEKQTAAKQTAAEKKKATQPTLDSVIFPPIERRQVPMVKISIGGSVDLEISEFRAHCSEPLELGRLVRFEGIGYLPDPHARWVKRSEQMEDGTSESWMEPEGQVKIKITELGHFELLSGLFSDDG